MARWLKEGIHGFPLSNQLKMDSRQTVQDDSTLYLIKPKVAHVGVKSRLWFYY